MTLYCICVQTFVVTCANISNILPEAICCCLQTCYVGVMLLCMCIPTFIVVTVLVV